ncbi:MAG: penicillin-binding protein 2, partial [Planctomycetota bacterium]
MYHYRLKIFILLCVGSLVIAVGRLVTLQTFQVEKARQELVDMRILPAQQRPTIRGQILDRNGKSLALDQPAFFLHIGYQLTRYRDPRWREGKIRRALASSEEKTRNEIEKELKEEWKEDRKQLEEAINLAYQLWWRRNEGKTWQDYRNARESITIQDIVTIDLREMKDVYQLVELKTHQDLLRAQKELLNLKALTIKTESKRYYPYDATVCQLIGWVAPWQELEAEIFKDDKYMSYKPGEVVGKFGLEKVYEPLLRGRRGEVQYDIEGNLLERTESQHGQDVRLTLDIDLQRKIEALLADNTLPHGNKYCAAVVLEVANNDILAM